MHEAFPCPPTTKPSRDGVLAPPTVRFNGEGSIRGQEEGDHNPSVASRP